MTENGSDGSAAEVWSATRIPGPCPIEGFGNEGGYSVAWVQVTNGPMLQVLVDGDGALTPGMVGHVGPHHIDEQSIDVFTMERAGEQ